MALNGIGINWRIGSFYGWGIFGLNLAIELVRKGDIPVALLQEPDSLDIDTASRLLLSSRIQDARNLERQLKKNAGAQAKIDAAIIHPATFDFDLFGSPSVKGSSDVCFIFFENTEFSTAGIKRANSFACVLAGSQWNKDVLQDKGVKDVRLAHQGVDLSIFHPAPRRNLFSDRFVIYSGGKLEYRKGQDIVVEAFRIFHQRHSDSVLFVNWQNMFSDIGVEISHGGIVDVEPRKLGKGKGLDIEKWLADCGLVPESYVDCGLVANKDLPSLIRESDVALFTSRCEGGTNLSAMESLACGTPTILSANTGHLDLIADGNCYVLPEQSGCAPTDKFPCTEGWGQSSVEELVETLEKAYRDRNKARAIGKKGAESMISWSWSNQVDNLVLKLG